MKNIFLISLTYLVLSAVNGQVKTNFTEGKVTFKSNKNVYVKFYSTENMRAKDTLYYVGVDGLVPSLIIKHLSTTSCVSENFTTHIFTEGETIKFKNTAKENEIEVQTIQTPIIKTIVTNSQESIDSTDRDTTSNNKRLQKINGRLSMSSNGSITDGIAKIFRG